MESLVQCPVCTLYLHAGMTLEAHLDTHPKDQVIKALCSISSSNLKSESQYGSRCNSPSEASRRSYRSRSGTPATQNPRASKLSFGSGSSEKDRTLESKASLFHRSRTPADPFRPDNFPETVTTPFEYTQTMKAFNIEYADPGRFIKLPESKEYIPAARVAFPDSAFVKAGTQSGVGGHFVFVTPKTELELRTSRDIGSTGDHTSCGASVLSYIRPTSSLSKCSSPNRTTSSSIRTDCIDVITRQNSFAVLKSGPAPLQYAAPSAKSVQYVLPGAQTLVQASRGQTTNISMISTSLPTPAQFATSRNHSASKNAMGPVLSNSCKQLPATTFASPTAIVTQNSQILYREMLHSADGKQYVSTVPALIRRKEDGETPGRVDSVYQNVMVVSPYGSNSCLYSKPPVTSKSLGANLYHNSSADATRFGKMNTGYPNKTKLTFDKSLMLEVGPIPSIASSGTSKDSNPVLLVSEESKSSGENSDFKLLAKVETNDMSDSSPIKGLKILSNIKVEVPVKHDNGMIGEIVDLTNSQDEIIKVETEELGRSVNESILPDLAADESDTSISRSTRVTISTESISSETNTFSVIKNVGNPSLSKEATIKELIGNATSNDDNYIVPDLTCTEKASASPCSELSNDSHADGSLAGPSCMPSLFQSTSIVKSECNINTFKPVTFAKKEKKVLQIKNAKFNSSQVNTSNIKYEKEEIPQSSCSNSSQNASFSSKVFRSVSSSNGSSGKLLHLKSPPINRSTEIKKSDVIVENDYQSVLFDASTKNSQDYSQDGGEDVSTEPDQFDSRMSDDFESNMNSLSPDKTIQVNNDDDESDDTCEKKEFIQLETMRPVNVIAFGSMNNQENILDNKQHFINENMYFNYNMYTDYFVPERGANFQMNKIESKGDPPIYSEDISNPEITIEIENEPSSNRVCIWSNPSGSKGDFILPEYTKDQRYRSDQIQHFEGGNNVRSEYHLGVHGRAGERDYSDLISRRGNVQQDCKNVPLVEEHGAQDREMSVNICADEKMPARGELSGQESNGDMDTPWAGMYPEMSGSTSYDLLARETWLSDTSDVEVNVKTEPFNKIPKKILPLPKRTTRCLICNITFQCLKDKQMHSAKQHPSSSTGARRRKRVSLATHTKTSLTIKQEAKVEQDGVLTTTARENITVLESSTTMRIGETDVVKVHLPKNELGQVLENLAVPKLEIVKKESIKQLRSYLCSVCRVDLQNEVDFNNHLKIHPLECLTCGKYFYKRANLQQHLKIHLDIRRYKCDLCEKRFLTKQKLREHHNGHTGEAPIKCSHCDERFRRFSNMVQHRNRYHLQIKRKVRDFVCHCGEVFHTKKRLLWHKELHEERPKACPYCSEKFVHAASLTRHIRRAHNSYYVADDSKRAENIPCPVCNQVYLKNNIVMHLRTHAGSKPFQCVVCNKSFTTKWNLKLHKWTHANRSSKPFKCTLCKGAFIRRADFVSHMHAHKSVKPYTCNYCGCQFIRKYNCLRHVKEHETEKRFVCKVLDCGKSFHRSYYLTEHMRVHSGARPFVCSVCGKTSSNKSNHNKHIRIHHAREPIPNEG